MKKFLSVDTCETVKLPDLVKEMDLQQLLNIRELIGNNSSMQNDLVIRHNEREIQRNPLKINQNNQMMDVLA